MWECEECFPFSFGKSNYLRSIIKGYTCKHLSSKIPRWNFPLKFFFKITNRGIFKVYSFLNSSLWSWFFPFYIKKGDISNYTKTCVKSAFEPQNTCIFLKTASFKKKSLISPWCAMVREEQSDFPSSLLQWFSTSNRKWKGIS